ncbi:hypothetical protein VKT23_020102 [Stygiomarasmius scandens]|uniref:ubiquitinyl hydrolase 1 n=1 Tax=Marasmiellus scandens TaxID=2682957 RepID=A0ABR1ILT9_9AGAR
MQVHFALRGGTQLIIQITHPVRGEYMELIPNDVFLDDLPNQLAHDYVHWLDLNRYEIEFRPLQTAWKSSTKSWKLILGDLKSAKTQDWQGATSQMIDGSSLFRLVDIHSRHFRMISRQFKRLEDKKNIIVMCCSTNTGYPQLDIHLPRYRLKFLVNQSGNLESVNFPGYCIASTQSVGTLFGLFNRLVLEASTPTHLPHQRVLIPLGAVNYTREGAHVKVVIDVGSSHHVQFYDYHVRADLGFLEGDGSLGCHFYRAYLHAITSHCLRDPLTGRTGIEECLHILRSSRSFSIHNLYDVGFSYLSRIKSLTPRRAFYPEHLRVMQTIHWNNNLPIWSQHPLLVLESNSILEYCQKLQKLYGGETPSFLQNPISKDTVDLVIRDIQRNSRFYVGLNTESQWSCALPDTIYLARDMEFQKELTVYKIASSIFQPPTRVNVNLQDILVGYDELYASTESFSLSYSLEWLDAEVPCSYWMSLFNLCCESKDSPKKAYQLMFSLTAMMYSNSENRGCGQLASTLVQLIHNPIRFESVLRPSSSSSSLRLSDGFRPETRRLKEMLESAIYTDQRRPKERVEDFRKRQDDCRSAIPEITSAILSQWPTSSVQKGKIPQIAIFPNAMWNPIEELFRSCYQNCELSEHIEAVQAVLDEISSSDIQTCSDHDPHGYKFERSPCRPNRSVKLLCSGMDQLLFRMPPNLEAFQFTSLDELLESSQSPHDLSQGVQSLISQLLSSSHNIQRLFGDELRDSCRALSLLRTESSSMKALKNFDKALDFLTSYVVLSHNAFRQTWAAVYEVLSPQTELEKILSKSELWPSLTPYSVLSLLAHGQRMNLTRPWKLVLILLGKRLVEYQRSQRLMNYASERDFDGLLKEMKNKSSGGLENPDWLLTQISSNFLARDIQISFAKEMINPSNAANAVLQLNMGEGKSSVIVPLIASSLPDGQKLVRVVVLKALSTQMFQLLVDRISNESDEILHVRYQLVYTIGKQAPVEDYPNRWITVQELLGLVFKHAPYVKREFPHGIHLQGNDYGVQSVPLLTILEEDALLKLLEVVASEVLNGSLSDYPFGRLPATYKESVKRFITKKVVLHSEITHMAEFFKGTNLWNGILLLRGLIAHGILAHCLQGRRWRVDYGLDFRRTLLAVPYRAKDVPALRSDFSHPDVAICLTCLAYYYGGLTAKQVEDSLEILLKSDNPPLEYEKWISGMQDVPRTVTAINLKDPTQLSKVLVPKFSQNRSVIDFYLSQVVFPKYALEFPEKLMTSGWDLTETKDNVVTGFSGTKDSQNLLPATITQCDPLRQESTNAQVIEHLLQPENDVYLCAKRSNNGRLSAAELISLVVEQPLEIRVLLDVGAQILDLDNEGVARLWLKLNEGIAAAVFFDKSDHMIVVDRQGDLEMLVSSQYRNQLGNCVIYLDDAHTRGTDLKLPRDYRAAVTLGNKVTKDRLLQGCMRMRQLGRGQSVMFLAPPEIDLKIRKVCDLGKDAQISSSDVLRWTYSETVMDIEHYIPNWIDQGLDYIQRKKAWNQFCVSGSMAHLAPWKQPESRTLEQMYGVGASVYEKIPAFDGEEYRGLWERCQKLGWDLSRRVINTRTDEEQEREVSAEIEKEQQVEKPPQKNPATHSLSFGLESFVKGGVITNINDFEPLLGTLGLPAKASHPGLLATKDFGITIRGYRPALDDYMRPVTWIISGGSLRDGTSALVVISPFEADRLRSDIVLYHEQSGLHLHVYTPKVTQNRGSSDDLRFLAIPPLSPTWHHPCPHMMMQLDLFAGQLYLPNWEAYKRLCNYLGLYIPNNDNSEVVKCQSDGFIKKEDRIGIMQTECPFTISPLPKLKELFGLRRKGNGYAFTHIGKILAGNSLEKRDFE